MSMQILFPGSLNEFNGVEIWTRGRSVPPVNPLICQCPLTCMLGVVVLLEVVFSWTNGNRAASSILVYLVAISVPVNIAV